MTSTATQKSTTSVDGRDLILRRTIDAPPEKVFRAWTDPVLLKEWFTPKPWTTAHIETDVRPGGSTRFVMRSPEEPSFLIPASISRWSRIGGWSLPMRTQKRGNRRRSRS
jgi:uncharacterized protein YndB with AHSA1/START domain